MSIEYNPKFCSFEISSFESFICINSINYEHPNYECIDEIKKFVDEDIQTLYLSDWDLLFEIIDDKCSIKSGGSRAGR